jgi:hypothetical protein
VIVFLTPGNYSGKEKARLAVQPRVLRAFFENSVCGAETRECEISATFRPTRRLRPPGTGARRNPLFIISGERMHESLHG